MRIMMFAALAALPLVVAAPAAAQTASAFTGARAGVTLGYDKIQGHDGFEYGGSIGYDAAIAPRVTLGAETTLEDSTASGYGLDASRDLAVSGRLGYVLAPNLLGFAKVGYDTARVETVDGHANFEGVRYGGGVELAVTPHTYVSAEYRRTEYEDNLGGRDAGIVGIGFRF